MKRAQADWEFADGLLLASGAALALALFIAVVSPLTLWNLKPPPAPSRFEFIVTLLGTGLGGLLRFGISIAIATLAYVSAIRAATNARNRSLITGLLLTLGLLMLAAAPTGSLDIYHYLAEGRIAAHHRLNPLRVAPQEVPAASSDPVLRAAYSWGNVPSRYGPVHLLLMELVSTIAGDHLLLGLALIKLFAFFAYLLTAWAVRGLASLMESGSEDAATIAFACNPVVLYEGVANAHTDIFMAALACCGLLFALRRHTLISTGLLVAATLVKFMTAPAVMLTLVYQFYQSREDRWRRVALAALFCLGLTALLYLPYFDGTVTLPFATSAIQRSASLHALVYDTHPELLTPVTHSLLALAVLVCIGCALVVAIRPSARSLLATSLITCTALVWMVSQMWWPWYLVTLLALGAPLGKRARQLCVMLTLGALLATVMYMWREIFGVAEWNGTAYNFLMVLASTSPAVSWLLLQAMPPSNQAMATKSSS